MGQSNAIFAALLISFVIYVTMRGHLPGYLRVLVGG